MEKVKISIMLMVYNEEHRIGSCLRSFLWADEIVFYDKSSTDKTREIAAKYTNKIIDVPFSDGSQGVEYIKKEHFRNDWILPIPAAALIHPGLVKRLVEFVHDPNFKYDVIGLPYGIYAFGIKSKYSPWYTKSKLLLIRKTVFKLSEELHREIGFESEKIFHLPYGGEEEIFYHLTHKDADDFFSKHQRYTRVEAEYKIKTSDMANRNKILLSLFFDVMKSMVNAFVRRRCFLLGWDGIALGLGYVSYFIMKFMFFWDLSRSNGNSVYPRIRSYIESQWDEVNSNKSKLS